MDTTGRVRRKHRSWPEALKREIVAAAAVPGASVSAVARQYGVNTNMVFTWRKRYGAASARAAPPQLVPVVVTPEQINATHPASAQTEGIEIELPRGARIGSVPASRPPHCAWCCMRWSGDDCVPGECAGLACGWASRLQVQQALGRNPHAGDLYVFRGARGDLIKILWHDGIDMSLYAKRLEKGRFIWPVPADGVVGISADQLALYAGRNRLEKSATNFSACLRRIGKNEGILTSRP